jgi:tol-pal system protein YbgF
MMPRPASVFGPVALLVLAAGLTGCVSGTDIEGIHAQVADVQRQVLQVQQQGSSKDELAQLQSAFSNQMQALLKQEADMQVKLGGLSAQIDQLQSKLEDTNYRLAQLSQQIAATQEARTPPTSEPGAPATPAPSDPQAMYQAAYSDYLKKNYDIAIMGFQQYLKEFPDTDLADNAAYWIGECLFSQGKYAPAIEEFDNVLTRFPRSDKIASAMLKKAYATLEIGQKSKGVAQLQRVIKDYPSSDEANLARQRLRAVNGG